MPEPLLPYFQEKLVEAGLDEAGRGCLAGPVVAAAVILPKNFHHPLINDSKKLTAEQRNLLRNIIEQEAIAFGIGLATHTEIDTINILKASFLAMHRAVEALQTQPGLLLVDGNRFVPYQKLPFECIIKGDGKYASIAAASILAKTYRDDWMEKLHKEFPHYDWKSNKGYPTKHHREAIAQHGASPHHRQSFQLLSRQTAFKF